MNIRISTRLNAGFLSIILLLVCVISIGAVGLNKANEGIKLAANEQMPTVVLLTHLKDNDIETERIGSLLALNARAEEIPAQVKSFEHLKARNAIILEGLTRSMSSSQGMALIQSIHEAQQQLYLVIQALVALRESARVHDQGSELKRLAAALAKDSVNLLAVTQAAIEFQGDSVQIYANQAQSAINSSKTYMWGMGALSVLLALLMAWMISRSVSRPLLRLQSVFAEVERSGDLSLRSDNQSGDEVGQVARGFNQMMEKQQANEAKIRHLLVQTDQQATRLQSQRDALEKSLEEVSRQSEALRANEVVLKDKNEEVALANADLLVARDKAEAASRTKSQFLANMSHELRTPMNAILGMLQLLHKTEMTPRQLDYTSKSENAAKSLLGLLNDILDLSKIDAGKMELDPHPFRLDELLQDLSVIFSIGVSDKPVEVLFDIAPSTPSALVGDAMRLKQILINLGSNAIKFTQQGTVVLQIRVVEMTEASTALRFAMIDSGIGIAPAQQQLIFEDFSQAEASTTRRFGGTGLGLSICKQLVTLMGGELKLDSEPGQGSTFYFTLTLPKSDQFESESWPKLPLQESLPQSPLQVPVVEVNYQGPLTGLRLLLVEDNLINQQVAQELLSAEGAQVVVAGNGLLGFNAVANASPPFDAVLMDLQMPVMDGFTATRKIREELGLTALPIIAMTANAMDSDRNDCLAAGMNAHVGKPFDLNQLVALLVSHCPPHSPA